jgi:glyoxylase-like metal-dependent hydrolase (beta-lactamase superfamily II)
VSLTRLDELTTVVLAPNPSPMTLEGTNTYLLGAPASGELVVVDPGPDLLDHRQAVDRAVRDQDATVVAVVVTHHHSDHAEAAGWAEQWGVSLHAFSPHLVGVPAEPLRDGGTVRRAGVTLEAVHTPGHSSDHLCLRVVETDAVLTGDHVLGSGTTVVAWPDGDMAAYLASLRRLGGLGAEVLYPGHGPTLNDPDRVVEQYIAHRQEREQQVLDALRAGDRTPVEIVTRVYADVDPVLHPAAERSVRAHLDKLAAEGAVTAEGEAWRV